MIHPDQALVLDRIKNGEKYWGYLDTSELGARYATAAHFLKNCDNIIELGGYKQTIVDYMPNFAGEIIVYSLDYGMHFLNDSKVKYMKSPIQDADKPLYDYGLVMLGFDLIGEIEPVVELAQSSQITIIEAPILSPFIDRMLWLVKILNRRVIAKILFDFSDNQNLCNVDSILSPSPALKRSMLILDGQATD